ncbi:MAG: transposase [Aeriscardovia sp.]|nr:transposase [Aeriscardovia sp.]
MDRLAKNQKIKETGKATRERRKDMLCRVFEVKVDLSRMSKSQRNDVNTLFREAKWFRNAYLADNGLSDKSRSVKVKVKDVFEERELTLLGSQIKQSIISEVKDSIRGLAVLKEKGHKVGALKFKSVCNCVNLKQFHVTYDIDKDRSRIRVQGIRKPFKVRGLEQIPDDAEIANAKFIRKASGLYFHITCYVPKEEKHIPHRSVGIDFGISDNLVFSDGREPVNICVPESKGTKLASRRMNKALSHNGNQKSNNHYKRKNKVRKAYEKDKNRRKDLANKAVHEILNNYDFIAIQDEMIHNWHKGIFGKQVQHSAMGVIKEELKNSSGVYVVSRDFPSTQICPECGMLTKHPLKKRSYTCQYCGYHHPSRDEKAAGSILEEAKRIYRLSGIESVESRGGQTHCTCAESNLHQGKVIACEAGSPCF